MKTFAITLLYLIPITVLAQNPMAMDADEVQKMMRNLKKAQECMAKVDRSEQLTLETKQMRFEEAVRSLCASGKRDAAQKRALLFEKEMSNSTLLKALNKCNQLMGSMAEEMSSMDHDEDYSKQHVCDAGL